MIHSDNLSTIKMWERSSRILVLFLLGLSALQFLSGAILYGSLGQTETDKLICAAFGLLAGLALATAMSFRKSGAPTWKHKLVVAVIAAPAAMTMLTRMAA